MSQYSKSLWDFVFTCPALLIISLRTIKKTHFNNQKGGVNDLVAFFLFFLNLFL